MTRLPYRAAERDRIMLILRWEEIEMERPWNKRPKAHVNRTDCVACGCCVKVCPLGAVRVFWGVEARVDGTACAGCGRCVKECPASAIELREAEQ